MEHCLKFLMGPLTLILFCSALSIPKITGVTTSGQTIAVSGSGFGTKPTAAPIKFDNFDNGTNGSALSSRDPSWKVYNNNAHGVNYSNAVVHSGALSVGTHIANGESFNTNYYTYPQASTEMFISYWWRTANGDLNDHTIIKMTRINSSEAAGGGGVYNGPGNTSLGGTYDLARNAGPYCAYNNGVTGEAILKYFKEPPLNSWIKVEMYKKLSTPGSTNGVMECNFVGTDYAIDSAAMTRAAGYSFLLNTVLLGTMDGAAQTHDYDIYIDDMYIDNSRARVEIGNSPAWLRCTKLEIQVPTQWADGQVACKLNMGAFTGSEPLYLYVVDANGAVNAIGFPLSPASIRPMLAPTPGATANPFGSFSGRGPEFRRSSQSSFGVALFDMAGRRLAPAANSMAFQPLFAMPVNGTLSQQTNQH